MTDRQVLYLYRIGQAEETLSDAEIFNFMDGPEAS